MMLLGGDLSVGVPGWKLLTAAVLTCPSDAAAS